MISAAPLRISAVGDISFEGRDADNPSPERFASIVGQLRRADLTVGNLECALTHDGHGGIPGKCTLRGTPLWATVLKQAGISFVTLANNHVMDFGPEGLFATMEALRRAGMRFAGAGRNREEACAPVFLDVSGRRVAFLGRSAVIVSAPTYAERNVPGVAFLETDETLDAIRACRSRADLVIAMIHWGIEEYCYPSPAQRALARRFVAAGADVVLGHHPHVLQGIERMGTGVVAYSLGNFAFDEFEWSYVVPDGRLSPQVASLSAENRRGVVATFEWTPERAGKAPAITTTFTRIGAGARVLVDDDPARAKSWRDLCAALDRRLYRLRWRGYALRSEFDLRLGEQASPGTIMTKLHRLRWRHVANAFTALLRSLRIVAEKTTNPYE
jgi:hypothetical protein